MGMTHIISPKVNNRQKDFIIGTILGGSSIVKPSKGKNCYLSMRSKNIEWLRFKATELVHLASNAPITKEKTNRWHSICYPIFNEFREMFYDNRGRRRLHLDNLSLLRDMALAVWFGDCGTFSRGHAIINTHIWKKKGTETIHEYFTCLSFDSSIIKQRNNYRIKLDQHSSESLWRLIGPHMPTFMPFASHQR